MKLEPLVVNAPSKKKVVRSTMMDIISVSLSTIFLLSLLNLLPLRKFMIPCQEVADQPKKVRKASLKIPWKYQWICQHGALWWLGCALPRKTQWTVSRESPGEQSNQSSKCSPGLSLGLVMTLAPKPRISNGQDTTVMGALCRPSPTMIFMISIQHISIHDE